MAVATCDAIPLFLPTVSAEHELVAFEAAEILGQDLELRGSGYGAISAQFIVPAEPSLYSGWSFPPTPCRRFVVSDLDSMTLAHELGHALGLQHSTEPLNPMNTRDPGPWLTDDQTDTIESTIRRMQACTAGENNDVRHRMAERWRGVESDGRMYPCLARVQKLLRGEDRSPRDDNAAQGPDRAEVERSDMDR